MNIEISAQSASTNAAILFLDKKFQPLFGAIPSAVEAEFKVIQSKYLAKKRQGLLNSQGEFELITAPILEEKGLGEGENLRLTAYKALKSANSDKIESLEIDLSKASLEQLATVLEGLHYATYTFDQYKSKKKKLSVQNVKVIVSSDNLLKANEINDHKVKENSAIDFTRDLVNTPGGDLTPQAYTQIIQDRFAQRANVNINVKTQQTLKEEEYNGLLTVGRGSQNPPVMVVLEYTPENAKEEVHLGLVGKWITFDTGGISLKPSNGMWEMRMDMGGSASVLGAFDLITSLHLPIKVTTVVCLAENRPGENACLPGDIFKAKNGKTIMVDNTDAEGRLVLIDGLYAVQEAGATHVLDLATLTGAIIRAIGSSITGVF